MILIELYLVILYSYNVIVKGIDPDNVKVYSRIRGKKFPGSMATESTKIHDWPVSLAQSDRQPERYSYPVTGLKGPHVALYIKRKTS